jgi:hypothetical protein
MEAIVEALIKALSRLVFELVFEVICYFTGRVLLPVLSLGMARAEAVTVDEGPFRWHGFRRTSNGTVVVQQDATALIGLVFWLVALTARVLLWVR